MLKTELKNKIDKLKEIIKSYNSLIVGFSGGVDSTFLSHIGYQTLEHNFLAITACLQSSTSEEISEAKHLAQQFNWPHHLIKINELKYPNFTKNPEDRCKWCKEIIFSQLIEYAKANNFNIIAAGDNTDDLKDYRPGFKHAKTLGIKSPLIEAGLSKIEIRTISKELGLPTYNKPSNPCLASRFPYETEITFSELRMVEQTEKLIKDLGYKQVRARHYKNMVRLELEKHCIPDFLKNHADLAIIELKKIGYTYIAIDIEGYRMGSLNKTIKEYDG